MSRYVAITLLLVVLNSSLTISSPLRVTIDCSGSNEKSSSWTTNFRRKSSDLFNGGFDVGSFCTLIQNALPRAVEDGKFVLLEPDMDQFGHSDTLVPKIVPPPDGFVPKLELSKLKFPKLKIPGIKVPTLRPHNEKHLRTPSVGTIFPFTEFTDTEEETSAEKLDKFKKGVQKLLNIVRVVGKIDQYISERTRILVEKLAKTFAE